MVERINAGPRMSQAVVHGDTVYLAGLTADDSKADVKGQTKQILDKIDALLAKAGTDKSKILSANICLPTSPLEPDERGGDAWSRPQCAGTRHRQALAAPGLKVEIMVQCAK